MLISRRTGSKHWISLNVILTAKRKVKLHNCTISIYDDRLEFVDESKGKKVFMLSDIVKMSMGGETKLYFTTSNGFYYEVGSHTRRSSVKYFALYRVLTGREYL